MESKEVSVLLIIIHCSLKEYKQTRGCKIAQTNLCRLTTELQEQRETAGEH